MLGLSYGELFLVLGATAALVGPKDLPLIARTAGRLAGRAIGYVQVARTQLEIVMHHSQNLKVNKEMQNYWGQIQAIGHEARYTTATLMNPNAMKTRLVDHISSRTPAISEHRDPPKPQEIVEVKSVTTNTIAKSNTSVLTDIHSQSITYERLTESTNLATISMDEFLDESGQFIILPVSAEEAKWLPNRNGELNGSDILLEAVIEADMAWKANNTFSLAQNTSE